MDLFVCGTSMASGFGAGLVAKDDPDISWPNMLAKQVSADNLYNFSLHGRPIGSSKREIVRFVEQYKQKFGSTKKLFVIAELSFPHYCEFSPMLTHANEVVLPIVCIKGSLFTDTSVVAGAKFDLRQYVKPVHDYFDGPKQMMFRYEYVPEAEIREDHLERLKAQVDEHFSNRQQKQLMYLAESYGLVKEIIDYLVSNDVEYLMFWAGDMGFKEWNTLRDRFFASLHDDKFIPSAVMNMQGFVKSNLDVEHYQLHPDALGHRLFANLLYDYVKEKYTILD